MINAIHWDVTPQLIDGWDTPNLYGLLFVTGLILGYFVIRRMYRKEGIPDAKLDTLVLYVIIATIVGARMGHVLFYGPYWDVYNSAGIRVEEGYFSHPYNIIKIWEGGLASHGGAFAILFALWVYTKRVSKKSYLWILDKIAAPVAAAGIFIRLGNLVNSEIVGKQTDLPWGFKFIYHPDSIIDPTQFQVVWENVMVRHPSQLYESLAYLAIFIFLLVLYWKREAWKQEGVVFGWFMILVFGARFLIEFTKEPQVTERGEWLLNTGQLLSIPFVLTGVYLLWRARKKAAQTAV
ncbi:MAG: prolipoprotein diacylglyceryl transferase [Fluviicola sp. XM-24bin1]|nr:MAG: prolipoprotein diacylglyceryl transferase [Fluviicola sp. XM-24bin1]